MNPLEFPSWLREIGLSGLLDMLLMTLLIYSVLVWLKRTRRAASVLTGIVIVAGIYLLARLFNLFMTVAVLQGFFAVILIALVVIFQEELRHLFEQVAYWSLQPLGKRKAPHLLSQDVEVLVRTLADLARERIGALVVIRGKNLLVGHLHGGDELRGQLTEGILKSIFDSHSIGHDGAVVVEHGVITHFGCHLPLSKNLKLLQRTGTRHAAALGLSELTDALSIVVSEERGTISVTRHGNLRVVSDPGQLTGILEDFLRETAPQTRARPWLDIFRRGWKEKLIALALAMALWFVLLFGAEKVYRVFEVPVEYAELSSELTVATIVPEKVSMTLSGPRKAFYFFSPESLKVTKKLTYIISPERVPLGVLSSEVSIPTNLTFESIQPRQVTFEIKSKQPPPEAKK